MIDDDFYRRYRRQIEAIYHHTEGHVDRTRIANELRRYMEEYGIDAKTACEAIARARAFLSRLVNGHGLLAHRTLLAFLCGCLGRRLGRRLRLRREPILTLTSTLARLPGPAALRRARCPCRTRQLAPVASPHAAPSSSSAAAAPVAADRSAAARHGLALPVARCR